MATPLSIPIFVTQTIQVLFPACVLLLWHRFAFSQLNMDLPPAYEENDTKDENFLHLVYDVALNVRMIYTLCVYMILII